MNKKYIPALIFSIYALLLAYTILHHEMWRDELQPWGIVTHSSSFSDLIENKKYEGHPILWFAILWLVSKITIAPAAIQVINYLLSLVTVWIIVFKSPFSTIQKALIIFGYYFFYEYAAISRDYMIAMMMIVSICVLWKRPEKHIALLMILFFVLCFTEVYASILSLTLAFTLFLQQFSRSPKFRWKSLLFPLAASSGFLVSYFTTVPPADSELNYPIHFAYNKDNLIRVLGDFWNGFIPIPKFQADFWSTSLGQGTVAAAVLGVILLVIILLQAFPYRILFIFLLTSFLCILSFMYFKYAGFQRHFGHLFIIYICYEWLKRYEPPRVAKSTFQRLTAAPVFYLLLLVNVCAGIFFAVADWMMPFSAGKQTAEYIDNHFSKQVTVAGYTDCPATTVANYLQRDIYLLNNLRKTSYIIFTTRRLQPNGDVILHNICMLADSLKSMVVVLNYPIEINGEHPLPSVGEEKTLIYHSSTGDHQIHFRNLIYFGKSMAGGESFYVYEVKEIE